MTSSQPQPQSSDTSRALWYVAYGANMATAGLARYLGDTPAPLASRWLSIPHLMYFAGQSARWSGGVAFVELASAPGGNATPARAYRIAAWQFHRVVAGENRLPSTPAVPDAGELAVGAWARLQIDPDGDRTRGKYDAVLRLADIEGEPALTVTTSRPLARRKPSPDYLDAIRAALASSDAAERSEQHLAEAVIRSVRTM